MKNTIRFIYQQLMHVYFFVPLSYNVPFRVTRPRNKEQTTGFTRIIYQASTTFLFLLWQKQSLKQVVLLLLYWDVRHLKKDLSCL